MSEGYVSLFANEDTGGNKPHFKGYIKIEGVEHEFALWPAKEGKKGFNGKYKPKTAKEARQEIKQMSQSEEIPFAFLIGLVFSAYGFLSIAGVFNA